jgi:hypothetical protein
VISFTPRPLYPLGEQPPVLIGWAPSRPGRSAEKKVGNRTPIPRPAVAWGGARLRALDASTAVCPVVPVLDDECAAVVGMRIGRGNRSTWRQHAQSSFVHHKSHKTWARTLAASVESRRQTT